MKSIKMIPNYGFLTGLSAGLKLSEDVVLLQGLNKRERDRAPTSLIRGSLKVVARGKKNYIDKITIRFIGRSSDVMYTKTQNSRYLKSLQANTIIQDAYEYGFSASEPFNGSYSLPFMFVLDADLPESITTGLGNRSYSIEVMIEHEGSVRIMLRKPICLIRGPLADSYLLSECIHSMGNWSEYMHHETTLSQKYMRLGDNFNLSFQLRPLFDDRTSEIQHFKVFFIQKIQCEKRDWVIGDNNTFDIDNKHLLKNIEDPDELIKDSNIYDMNLPIKLPKSMPFNVHPHISNNHLENYLSSKSFKITHYIQIVLTVKSTDKKLSTKGNSETKEASCLTPIDNQNVLTSIPDQSPFNSSTPFKSGLVFAPKPVVRSDINLKIPIYLLPGGQISQQSPPTYEEATVHKPSRKIKANLNPLKFAKIKTTTVPPAYSL